MHKSSHILPNYDIGQARSTVYFSPGKAGRSTANHRLQHHHLQHNSRGIYDHNRHMSTSHLLISGRQLNRTQIHMHDISRCHRHRMIQTRPQVSQPSWIVWISLTLLRLENVSLGQVTATPYQYKNDKPVKYRNSRRLPNVMVGKKVA